MTVMAYNLTNIKAAKYFNSLSGKVARKAIFNFRSFFPENSLVCCTFGRESLQKPFFLSVPKSSFLGKLLFETQEELLQLF